MILGWPLYFYIVHFKHSFDKGLYAALKQVKSFQRWS